ncbi:hypothetical protein [Brevundimonas sp.]|uniref:hypothetical protein n=1 Tax=Brevundimonas sp. TaxID=1871086 RepID=UPI002896CBF6|nr:hypothetical protein [Brevundimonas sp.]
MAIEIEEPLSISRLLLESTVTAAPLVTETDPPLEIRILSAAVPVALDVVIGVVRAVEITVSDVV